MLVYSSLPLLLSLLTNSIAFTVHQLNDIQFFCRRHFLFSIALHTMHTFHWNGREIAHAYNLCEQVANVHPQLNSRWIVCLSSYAWDKNDDEKKVKLFFLSSHQLSCLFTVASLDLLWSSYSLTLLLLTCFSSSNIIIVFLLHVFLLDHVHLVTLYDVECSPDVSSHFHLNTMCLYKYEVSIIRMFPLHLSHSHQSSCNKTATRWTVDLIEEEKFTCKMKDGYDWSCLVYFFCFRFFSFFHFTCFSCLSLYSVCTCTRSIVKMSVCVTKKKVRRKNNKSNYSTELLLLDAVNTRQRQDKQKIEWRKHFTCCRYHCSLAQLDPVAVNCTHIHTPVHIFWTFAGHLLHFRVMIDELVFTFFPLLFSSLLLIALLCCTWKSFFLFRCWPHASAATHKKKWVQSNDMTQAHLFCEWNVSFISYLHDQLRSLYLSLFFLLSQLTQFHSIEFFPVHSMHFNIKIWSTYVNVDTHIHLLGRERRSFLTKWTFDQFARSNHFVASFVVQR